MVLPEFCGMLEEGDDEDNEVGFYTVNCVTDLDEDGGEREVVRNGIYS